MSKETKGIITRKNILDSARQIFNTKGINLTIDLIARELNISKGKITNHFPTKDNLFLAIVADYEYQFQSLLKQHYAQFESVELQSTIFILSKIMDIQFEYRCGIVYSNMLGPSQSDLSKHIKLSFQKNSAIIKSRVGEMVKTGILKKEILDQENFISFQFIYVNMLTQWVVFYEMYDNKKKYNKVKAPYLRAILRHSYYPFLTAKGQKVFESLNFNAD